MLDEEAIHIDDVKRAVGSCASLDRAKPIVARTEKFALLFVGGPGAGEKQVAGENFPMHQVVDWFARKNVTVKFRSEMRVSINTNSACGCHTIRVIRIVEPIHQS